MFDREGLTTTTNRIAERAGVSIGSLYQYFPNKHSLLEALAERHVRDAGARLRRVFDRVRAEQPPFEETMRSILEELVALHADRPALHGLMHRLAPRRAADLAAIRAFEDWVADEVAEQLRRCGRGGADPAATAQTVVHAVDAHLHRVQTRHRPDAAELFALVDQLTS